MKSLLRSLVLGALTSACALSHSLPEGPVASQDGSIDRRSDAATAPLTDAHATDASRDAGPRSVPTSAPRCGPNRCRAGEICCDARCGICAFEAECPTSRCAGP